MAGITGITGFRGWPHWLWAGFLGRSPNLRVESVAVEVEAKTRPDLRTRRTYAPARDAFLEYSAMRREMYRL